MSTSHPERISDVQEILCVTCQTTNSVDRRFCARCGARLSEPCPECRTPNAIDVVFCGHCGCQLADAFEKRLSDIKGRLEKSESLRQEGHYLEAISLLQAVQSRGDSRLEPFVAEAATRIESLSEERGARAEEAVEWFARSRASLAEFDQVAAKAWLEKIPPGLRDREMNEALRGVEATLAEIAELTAQIRTGLQQKAWEGMLAQVTRLLTLRPQDTKLQQLSEQLRRRDHQQSSDSTQRKLLVAKQRFLEGQYAAAGAALAAVDDAHVASAHRPLFDTIREVDWLVRDLRREPFASSNLATVAARWHKLRPQDEDAARMVGEARTRLAVKPKDPRFAPRWAKAPAEPFLGWPLEYWRGLRGIEGPVESEAWKSTPSRFLVAYGLALQGLDVAHLKINLLPRAEKSFLPRLSLRGKAAPMNDVWGLDMGASGLKALRLSRATAASDSPLTVDDARFVPHAKDLAEAGSDEGMNQIMRATMEAFVEQAELEQAAVVLGFPGPRSLGRNFEIPKFKGKKSAEAIAYEARMQIPIPADAIYYDWHPWPAAKDATFEKVALLAARREHVQRVIDLCQDLPLKPLAVQSVCIALYNAAVHELLEEPADVPVKASAKGPAAETRDEPPDSARDNAHRAIAILDLGAESTSLVVASRSLIRFRNIALGTHRLDQALMSRFQLTRAQARQLRERPQSARWMYQTDEVVCEFADELSREVRRTLRVFEAEEIVIERLLCTGGAAEQLGLLRFLVHGE